VNAGTLIAVGGVAVAAFLYWRSQQAQAAALAAAQGAPGPGFLQKFGNTVKTAIKDAPDAAKAAAKIPLQAEGWAFKSIGNSFIGHGISGAINTVRGIF